MGDSDFKVSLMQTPLLGGGEVSLVDSFAGTLMNVLVEAGDSLELMWSLLFVCWSTPVEETGEVI
jgi:hypothetical protein